MQEYKRWQDVEIDTIKREFEGTNYESKYWLPRAREPIPWKELVKDLQRHEKDCRKRRNERMHK